MSGHTPGPWRRGGLHVSAFVIVPQGTETHPVADVYGEANARLIAAAPDLLDACKAALDPNVSMGLADKMLRSAIAKATGETP